MNLIEQLGGHEKAKSMCDHINGPLGLITDGYSHYTKAMVVDALLKYRLQHNIFESGDWVVKACRLKDDTLYQIDEIAESKNYVKTKCGVFIDAPMFKHATSEEIAAGHRL